MEADKYGQEQSSLPRPAGGGGGGGGGVLSYIHRLGPFFGVKILNFNICLGFQNNKYFLGMKILWIFFLGSSPNPTIFRGHFYAFQGIFFRSWHRMGDIFWGC